MLNFKNCSQWFLLNDSQLWNRFFWFQNIWLILEETIHWNGYVLCTQTLPSQQSKLYFALTDHFNKLYCITNPLKYQVGFEVSHAIGKAKTQFILLSYNIKQQIIWIMKWLDFEIMFIQSPKTSFKNLELKTYFTSLTKKEMKQNNNFIFLFFKPLSYVTWKSVLNICQRCM